MQLASLQAYTQTETQDIVKQDSTGFILVRGSVEKNNKPLENASVIIYQNNKKLQHLRTPASGKFTLNLPYNKYYKIEINKMGMVTKKFEFDTQLPAGISKQAVFPFEFTIVLFPKYNYIDMSILEKPLAIIRYDKKYEDFFYDYNYAKTINDKVIYIQNKIEELTKEYAKCVDDGRKLLDEKEYRPSLAKFERAHEIFPDEPYPIQKIALIKKILNEKKTKKEIYAQIIQEAEDNVKKEEYERAIELLQQALQVMPTEKYPSIRIKEIRKLIDNLGLRENSYRMAIEKADKLFDFSKLPEARKSYTEASSIFPRRTYPIDRIGEIDKLLTAQKETQQEYDNNVTVADKLYEEKKFDEALGAYNNVLKKKPDDKYAKDKVNNINVLLGKNKPANQQTTNNDLIISNEYKRNIREAEKHFENRNYSKAMTYYKMAGNLKPGEQTVKDKISQLDILLSDDDTKNKEYDKIIQKANEAYTSKSWAAAKQLYSQASYIKPLEVFPKDRIVEINNLLKDLGETNSKYEQAIRQADKLFNAKSYDDARQFYLAASYIKPDEQYPEEQIALIDKLLNNVNAIREHYNAIIAKADKYFNQANTTDAKNKTDNTTSPITELLNKALSQYSLALKILPDEEYPKTRINEINKLLLAKTNTDIFYSKAIKQADQYFNQAVSTGIDSRNIELYNNAISSYQTALDYKPAEKYPTEQISRINKILDDIKQADNNYNKIINEANDLFASRVYQEARESYMQASKLKPFEQYPKTKIAEITKILNDQLAQRTLYENLIATAEKMFKNKEYTDAKSKYEEASAIFIDEPLPKERIREINNILANRTAEDKSYSIAIAIADSVYKTANSGIRKQQTSEQLSAYNEQLNKALSYYTQALKIKPGEPYPSNKIEEINKIFADQKNKEETYEKTIGDADAAYKQASPAEGQVQASDVQLLNKALNLYSYALTIKPGEAYPQAQIEQINTMLEKSESIQSSYFKLLGDADRLFKDRDYISSKMNYQEALTIRPDEQYPNDRITEIDKILTNQQARIEAFWKVIETADETFDLQDYKKARNLYLQANSLIPTENYPKQRIEEINKILSTQQSVEVSYAKLILVADRALSSKDYERSKELYSKASELKPYEKYPKTQLTKIDVIIQGFEANKQLYNSTVLKADDLFELKQYREARELYKKARELNPIQKHAKQRIAEINDLLRAEEYAKAIGEINKELIEKLTEKKYSFNPISDKKGNNYVLIEAKNLSHKRYNVLVYYGKDDQSSGGLVFNVKDNEEIEKYVVRVGAQDAWFRINNNWISIQPLGGDLEIYSIQILQGN